MGVIQITSLNVPDRVENGSVESVILDCVYTMDEDEDKQLVVKWFFNDDPVPIYQWIPELKIRSPSSRLIGKMNHNYTIQSGNQFTKYRAIEILKPTTEFSGRYSCNVASLMSQDQKEKTMIVYGKLVLLSLSLSYFLSVTHTTFLSLTHFRFFLF